MRGLGGERPRLTLPLFSGLRQDVGSRLDLKLVDLCKLVAACDLNFAAQHGNDGNPF